MSKADLIKSLYTNPASVMQYAAPNFRIHSTGRNMIAGLYTGLAEVKARFELMDAMTNNTFEHSLVAPCLADDTWGMSVVRLIGQRKDKSIDMFGFGLWKFEGDLITDHWECPCDMKAWDEFWS